MLLGLCRSDMVKEYGYHQVLRPIIERLNILGSRTFKVGSDEIKFFTGTALGDNLCLNPLSGLRASFTKNIQYPCRQCVAVHKDIRNVSNAENMFQLAKELRSHDNFRSDLNSGAHGIDRMTPLLFLHGYDVAKDAPGDIPHNFNGGVGRKYFMIAIKSLVSNFRKEITLDKIISFYKVITLQSGRHRQNPIPNFSSEHFNKADSSFPGGFKEFTTTIQLTPLAFAQHPDYAIVCQRPQYKMLVLLKDLDDYYSRPHLTGEDIQIMDKILLQLYQLRLDITKNPNYEAELKIYEKAKLEKQQQQRGKSARNSQAQSQSRSQSSMPTRPSSCTTRKRGRQERVEDEDDDDDEDDDEDGLSSRRKSVRNSQAQSQTQSRSHSSVPTRPSRCTTRNRGRQEQVEDEDDDEEEDDEDGLSSRSQSVRNSQAQSQSQFRSQPSRPSRPSRASTRKRGREELSEDEDDDDDDDEDDDGINVARDNVADDDDYGVDADQLSEDETLCEPVPTSSKPKRKRLQSPNRYVPPIAPKEHYLAHGTQGIKDFGPVPAGSSGYRGEQSHCVVKSVINDANNRKNILLTPAISHEYKMAYLSRRSPIVNPVFQWKELRNQGPPFNNSLSFLDAFGEGSFIELANLVVLNTPYLAGTYYHKTNCEFVKIEKLVKGVGNSNLGFFGKCVFAERDEILGVIKYLEFEDNAAVPLAQSTCLVLLGEFKTTFIRNDKSKMVNFLRRKCYYAYPLVEGWRALVP